MGDILVVIVILAILGGAIYKLYWNKKNNVKCSSCSSCPLSSSCNYEKSKQSEKNRNN